MIFYPSFSVSESGRSVVSVRTSRKLAGGRYRIAFEVVRVVFAGEADGGPVDKRFGLHDQCGISLLVASTLR